MYSRGHALVAGFVGLPVAIGAPDGHSVLLWAAVVLLGVGIDFDHFAIARLNRGDWSNLRQCLAQPAVVFGDQSDIFDTGDVWRDQRLLSHLLIGGVLTTAVWTIDQYWAFATAIAIYTHVLADLYADTRTRPEYLANDE
jgi:hypothetical protein